MRIPSRKDSFSTKIARLEHAIDAAKHRCEDHPRDRRCMLELDRLATRRELLEEEPSLRNFRRTL